MFQVVRKLSREIFSTERNLIRQSQIIRLSHHTPIEISIKVPWGHIAGLHWNKSSSGVPVLCIHGWKDNAASFNKIIPAILDHCPKYQFVSIDLPGHGLSSHYPEGMLYQLVDNMINIRRVIRYLGWKEEDGGIHLMGHSMGAILGFVFAATHPNLVHCLIAIDALVPVMFANSDFSIMLNYTTERFLHMESKEDSKNKNPVEKNELWEKMQKSHMMGWDKESCAELFSRAVVESPAGSGKFKFSHDPRVHFATAMMFNLGQIKYLAKCFQSHVLYIRAENGVNYMPEYLQTNLKVWLAQENKSTVRFTLAKKALHHVHLGEPKKILTDVVNFLSVTHPS